MKGIKYLKNILKICVINTTKAGFRKSRAQTIERL